MITERKVHSNGSVNQTFKNRGKLNNSNSVVSNEVKKKEHGGVTLNIDSSVMKGTEKEFELGKILQKIRLLHKKKYIHKASP